MVQTGNVYLIDTRPPLFFRLGHIGGANSLPLIKYDKALASQRAQLDAAAKSGKPIVTYCQNTHCPDAHRMAKKLAWPKNSPSWATTSPSTTAAGKNGKTPGWNSQASSAAQGASTGLTTLAPPSCTTLSHCVPGGSSPGNLSGHSTTTTPSSSRYSSQPIRSTSSSDSIR